MSEIRFTWKDVDRLQRIRQKIGDLTIQINDDPEFSFIDDLSARIAALLPPRDH